MVTDVGYITSKHEISVGGRRHRRVAAPSHLHHPMPPASKPPPETPPLLQLATAAATEALERACCARLVVGGESRDSRRDSSSTRVLMFDVSYNGQFFSPSRAAQPKTQNPGRGAAQNPKPGPLTSVTSTANGKTVFEVSVKVRHTM